MSTVFPFDIDDPGMSLTVADYVRLAASGIKIEYSDIRRHIMPDPPPTIVAPPPLADLIWERWRRREITLCRNPENFYSPPPFKLFATEACGRVYVFVATHNSPPVIIEDSTDLFPSDALMASLILWLETKK